VRKFALLSLKIPPQEEVIDVAAPSVLHLIHPMYGGDQIISLMFIGLGGWTITSNFFNVTRSLTGEFDLLDVLLPERLTADIMELMANLQFGFISWNLHWFLEYQIVLKILTIEAWITVLHYGDQPLSQMVHISSIDWKCKVESRIEAKQHQIMKANLHSKNKWKDDSA